MHTTSYTIIVVDDESMVKLSLKVMIEELNQPFSVIGEAKNGKEALEVMERLAPDIVITDIRMPVMNGLKLLHEIKSKYADTEVILLSGYDDFDYVQQALRLSAADYLLKPIKPGNVRKALLRIFNRLQRKRQAALNRMEYFEYSKTLAGKLANHLWLLDHAKVSGSLQEIRQYYTGRLADTLSAHEFYSNILVWVEERLKLDSYNSPIFNREAAAELINDKNFAFSSVELFFERLLQDLTNKRNRTGDEIVRSSVQYMEENYQNYNLTVSDIATHIGFSESHLRNAFKKETGSGVIQFLSKIRMEAAKKMLANPNATASEIAVNAGFSEYAHFCRVFRKYTGLSPSEYRKRLGRTPEYSPQSGNPATSSAYFDALKPLR